MKLSEVFKVTGKYGKRQENINLIYKIWERQENMRIGYGSMKLSIANWEIWEQKENIGGTARHGKWQDAMTSDRKLLK